MAGQVQKMTQEKLGLNKDGAVKTQTEKQAQTLDDILAELDKDILTEAKGVMTEAKLTNLKVKIAEMKARIRELENQPAGPRQGGEGKTLDSQTETVLALRREVAANAMALLKEGVNSETVGKYLQTSLSTLSPAPGVGGPASVSDIASLITAISGALKGNSGGSDPEIKALLKQLVDSANTEHSQTLKELLAQNKTLLEEVKTIKAGAGSTEGGGAGRRGKVKVIKPDMTVEEFEDGEPIIIQPPASTTGAENVEAVRERNRHDEKMEEIRIEGRYKDKLGDTISEIPERAGSGFASHVLGQRKSDGQSGGPKLEFIECPDCHSKVNITPQTGASVTCTCGNIFTRKLVVETKQE